MLRISGKPVNSLKPKLIVPLIAVLAFIFLGWGSVGHHIINYNTVLSALPQLEFFNNWADSLAAHASDADYRKSSDPDEGPKHYIDIDNYPEFTAEGTIPQDFDSLVAAHGYSFVIKQGILPWAIINTADSLESLFKINDMHQAMLIAADLGHYIADSHMPLHITRNYNGQYTDQYDVHFRYESDLIEKFQSQIIYDGNNLQYIENVPDFVFNMIYENYQYVDSVLYADAMAEAYAGNNYSTEYYNKFWEIAKNFTIGLFRKASYRIACVIYTEWINAGGTPTGLKDPGTTVLSGYYLSQNYPNPFNPATMISYQLPDNNFVSLKVYNILGQEVAVLVNDNKSAGFYNVRFDSDNLPSGIYLYKIRIGSYSETKKMTLLK